MCKLCWGVSAILVLALLGGAYKFIVQGSAIPAPDGRNAIMLESGERDLVLTEMRGFLTSVQQITQAVSERDMKLIAEAASKSGAAATHAVPASLMGKLPLEFKKLGLDTHGKFDELALDAQQLGDPTHSLQQLSALMSNCLACHQAYRIDPTPAPDR
ncbi:MAG: cytochrome c [Candidatus Thiothrix singaporensis]|uniref:Cytochrome c n=1 Tax=Candidatus Thiothrix singaporensis TaxID=2799669 RepID=A0A7L6ASF1_9GAMM|nr:MAG: cytochrome c [Candidatus Thiothrix singaporensis]